MRAWLLVAVGLIGSLTAQADPFAAGATCPTATLAEYIASPGGCSFGGGIFFGFNSNGAISPSNVLVTPTTYSVSEPFTGPYSGFIFSGANGPLYSGPSSATNFSFGYYLGVNSTQRISSLDFGVTYQNATDRDFYVGSRAGIVGGPAVNYEGDPGPIGPTSGRRRISAVATPFGDLTVGYFGRPFPTAYTFNTTLALQASTDPFQVTSIDETFYIPIAATPEPSTWLMLSMGAAAILARWFAASR